MLKIIYPICCRMDVHKSFAVACIATINDYGVTTYKSKRFSTFTNDLRRYTTRLAKHHCKDIVYGVHEEILDSYLQYSGGFLHPLFWPTPNTSRQSEGRERTERIPSVLPTSSNTI